MKIIFCRGGTRQHTDIVLRTGWLYGLRSDSTAYHNQIEFLDINYQKGRAAWAHHIKIALKLRPALTMVPDWEPQYTYDELYRIHKQLTNAGLATMWTPKQHGIAHMIPYSSVIGVSVPTKHGAFLPQPHEVAGRKLHFLGGEPDAIRYLMTVYNKSIINSIDTSNWIRHASLGKLWSRSGYWIQTPKHQYSTNQLIVLNALSIYDYLTSDTIPPFNMSRKPILRCWQQLNNVNVNQLELAI